MRLIYTLIIISITFACTPKLDKQVLDLVTGKDIWHAKVYNQHYSYDYVQRCYCSFNGVKFRVVSSFSELISAKTIDGSYVSGIKLKTMKQHFEHILTLLEEQVSNPEISLNVEYDDQLGYPTKIEYKGSGADNWFIFELSNVKLLGREKSK